MGLLKPFAGLRSMPIRATLLALALAAAAALATPALAAPREVDLLVKFRPGATSAERTKLLASVSADREGAVRRLGVQVVAVEARAAARALRRLRASGEVAYAERDRAVRAHDVVPNDPYYTSLPWPFTNPGFGLAWETTTGGTVKVAVLDSGVNPVADLGDALLPGYDFVNGDADPADDQGHGTSVAGLVAARGNNGIGIAGGCWGCKILPVKVLDADGFGSDSDIASGITWAADNGAQVINLSLGGPDGTETLASAVAYAQTKGALVIASAGNDGVTAFMYPAAYPGVISVGASDSVDARYDFSNYGSWVQVAAAGCAYTTTMSGGVGFFCGTSGSAPIVSGLAGLALTLAPSATADQVADAIRSEADPVPGDYVADGRIDAPGTLAALGTLGPPVPPVNLELPGLSGRVEVGHSLAATSGKWNGSAAYSYAWQRCDTAGAGCAAIAGATAASYVPVAADAGSRLRVSVTATRASLSTSAVSWPSAQVATSTTPASISPPAVTGIARVGDRLHVSPGGWSRSSSFTWQWLRCDAALAGCSAIEGATGADYAPVAADVGSRLAARAFGTGPGGRTLADSFPTAAVVDTATPVNSTRPTISGTLRVGSLLVANPGTWRDAGAFAWQWLRCDAAGVTCAPIVGATASTYRPVALDAGLPLVVRVTVSFRAAKVGADSLPTAPIAALPAPVNVVRPSILGSPLVGNRLSSIPGEWRDAVSFSYRWLRCTGGVCAEIDGATKASYVVGAADSGATIALRVTAENATGKTSADSLATATVAG